MILLGACTALELVFTAKSIVRYQDISSGNTTYYLTGSVANVTYSLVYGSRWPACSPSAAERGPAPVRAANDVPSAPPLSLAPLGRPVSDDDLAALHDHLAATAELPVERSASRWLGEAEALAADLRESDLPADAVADRLRTIRKLLDEVEGTGDETADEHVEAARERLAAARARRD